MKSYKKFTINGFDADVLNEKKAVCFRLNNGDYTVIEIQPEKRVTAKFLESLISENNIQNFSGHVRVRHYRYLRYMLRCVMKETSGTYEVTVVYEKIDGKFKRIKQTSKSELI